MLQLQREESKVPERINIAGMAEIVSSDIFGKLGWERYGPPNHSWECVVQSHEKSDHPTDVTFVYQDPYTGKNLHLVTDLKSYARDSIVSSALRDSLESLALAVDCAKQNPNWSSLYLKPGSDFEVQGLLFVYNHDGDYDRAFPDQLQAALDDSPRIPQGVRLWVLGPDDIWYMNEMIVDLASLAQDNVLPPALNEISFYYPSHSRRRMAGSDRSRVATIEILKGKYQLLAYQHNGKRGMLVYYRGPGSSEREFIVLIDMLRIFGILDNSDEIRVRCPRAADVAAAKFQAAVRLYAEHWPQQPEKMRKLSYASVQEVRPRLTQFEVAARD
jgi:hypothetical protein